MRHWQEGKPKLCWTHGTGVRFKILIQDKAVLDLQTTQGAGNRGGPTIRAICLDFGNVLVPFDYARLWQRMARHATLSAEEMARRFEESEVSEVYESGKISSRRFYSAMCSLLKAQLTYGEFCGAWSSIFDTSSTIELSFLSSLAREYGLVLLSNTNEIHFTFMRRHFSILRVFHHLALSYQVGVTKPGAAIYSAALNMAHVNAEEAFYADDIERYVDAALVIGLRAARVSTKDELISAMRLHGIRVPR